MPMQSRSSLTPPYPAPARGAVPVALAERLDASARRHGFGPEAAQAMWDAVALGRGSMAQCSHPEFGGSGQWMRGGMVMVGDMFNRSLSVRVGALSSQHGPVNLATLRRAAAGAIAGEQAEAPQTRPTPAPSAFRAVAPPADTAQDVLDTIDKLAELQRRGVLTEDEFSTRKAQLLARL